MTNIIEEKRIIKRPNNIIMENRKTLMISGVTDMGSFDEQTAIIFTELGELTVKGTSLHMDKLNLEIGEVGISGKIHAIVYTDERDKNGGFFSKLFR